MPQLHKALLFHTKTLIQNEAEELVQSHTWLKQDLRNLSREQSLRTKSREEDHVQAKRQSSCHHGSRKETTLELFTKSRAGQIRLEQKEQGSGSLILSQHPFPCQQIRFVSFTLKRKSRGMPDIIHA